MHTEDNIHIDINSGKKILTVKGGSSLRDTLGQEGIMLPSACGGRAVCGLCKVKVLSTIDPPLPKEVRLLSTAEQAENIRLACQIELNKDIRIIIPEELFTVKKYRAEVISCSDLNYDTKELRLRLLKPENIYFQPGQYAQLIIPPHDAITGGTERAYSFASLPKKTREVEFIIRLVPGGIATTYIHKELAPGRELSFAGPMGEFRLHDEEAIMICIAGGSGMAPFKSMLFDMIEKKKSKPEIWFFYGAISKHDLYHLELWQGLEKSWPIFHFVPALSRPLPEDNWKGETGLITEIVEKYLREKIGKTAAAPKEGYLCGSPGMIDAAVSVLKQFGVPPHSIYFDKYT
jgi:Na+-transporting NADH:ubiquinone oxidoreductase subunit F